MRIIKVVTALALALALCSCNAKAGPQEQATNGSTQEETSLVTTTESQSSEPQASDAQSYDYESIAKLQNAWQTGSSLISTQIEFCKTMWSICKYDDSKDVHDTFTHYLTTSGDTTISDSVLTLSTAVAVELERCDPNIAPLLSDLSEKYNELSELVINPTGTYAEYIESYDSCLDEFVFAYDELVEYLYEVGYYTE